MRKTRKDTGASLLPPEQTPPPTPSRDCRRGLKVVDGCGLAAALASKGGRRRRCPRQRRWGTPPQAHPAPPVPACIPRPACLIRQGASFEPRDPYSPPPALPSPRPLCCFPFSLFLFCLDWPAWSAGLNRSPPASPAARGTAATRAAPRRRRRGRPHRLRPMPSVPRQLRWGTPPPHATLPRTTLFRSYPPLRSSPARARALQRTPPALSDKLTPQRLPPPCCFSFFFLLFCLDRPGPASLNRRRARATATSQSRRHGAGAASARRPPPRAASPCGGRLHRRGHAPAAHPHPHAGGGDPPPSAAWRWGVRMRCMGGGGGPPGPPVATGPVGGMGGGGSGGGCRHDPPPPPFHRHGAAAATSVATCVPARCCGRRIAPSLPTPPKAAAHAKPHPPSLARAPLTAPRLP